jgi:16S rRNA (cytosine1402-N4)-methyltransferase
MNEHLTVLEEEVVRLLDPPEGGVCLDGTLGGAGHAEALLRKMGPSGRLLGIDQDMVALGLAGERLAPYGDRVMIEYGNFSEMKNVANKRGIEQVDSICLDLGLSSNQLNSADRGFSFMQDGPLDMRMDSSQGFSAKEWVAVTAEEEMARIFWTYGEERASRKVAQAIAEIRELNPITTTGALVALIEKVIPRRGRIHPATRVFQAIRIAVNDELEHVRVGLEQGIGLLKSGGRMAVISFHSLEDRLTKQAFTSHVGRMASLAAGGEEWEGVEPRAKWIQKKPLQAEDQEVRENPRARSAKLRVIERL